MMQKFSMNTAVNASQQNQINLSLIFNYLRSSGWTNRARIADELGLSIPAVSRSMETLEETGCIIKQAADQGTTRKGTLVYSVNPDHGFVLAVDLLSIETAIVVVDFAGRIRCAEKGFKPEESTDVVRDLVALIDRCMDRFVSACGHPAERIRAISLGVPAVVNRNTGKLMLSYYEKYEAIDFPTILKAHYGVPVHMENISSLSALGEQAYGESSPGENVVLIEIGNGIGSGILINGYVHRGNGFAGEIGFSVTDADEVILPSRRTGFLEKKASLSAVKLNVLRELSFGVESSLASIHNTSPSEITPHVIFQHALDGDRLCQMAITTMVRQISTALHNVVVILDPDAIIIGGDACSMPGAKSLLIEPIRERLEISLPFSPPSISLSSLGSKSGILGAATIAIESILQSEWPYQRMPASG